MTYTTKLNVNEARKRLNRLDTLRVLVEGFDEGTGLEIYNKVMRALNNCKNFTGIIRLDVNQKDFLSYIRYESDMISDEDKAVLDFYLKY